MRILIATDAIYPFSMGGSHRLVYEASLALARRGHEVTCVVPEIRTGQQSAHRGEGWSDRDGLRIVTFPIDRRNLFTTVRSFFIGFRAPVEALLAREHFDVVNVQYAPALFALRHLASHPLRYTFHGPWSGELRLSLAGRVEGKRRLRRLVAHVVILPLVHTVTTALERYSLARCASYLTMSDYMRTLLVRDFGVPADAVRVIPAGVDPVEFHRERDPALRRRLAADSRYLLLSVRRLERRMGLDNLIRAAALLRDRGVPFRLVIGGKGHQALYLQRLIDQLGLAEHVEMLGFIPDDELRRHLSCADLFVLPSRDLEGFGLVVLESMACGTPVLVSPIGGAREILGSLDPRFVLESVSPPDIADRIQALAEAALIGRESGSDAVLAVAREHSWDRFAARYEQWLSETPRSAPFRRASSPEAIVSA